MAVSSQANIDESTLVAQAREGDTVAFGELVRRYEGKIFRLAQHITQMPFLQEAPYPPSLSGISTW